MSTTTSRRLYIGNLPGRVSPHQIADALVDFRNSAVCVFNPSVKAQRASSYAFVTFEEDTDLDAAVLKLTGIKIGNRTIAVAKADPTKKKETRSPSADSAKTFDENKDKDQKSQPKLAAAESKAEPKAAAKPKAVRRKLPESDDTVYVSGIPLETAATEVNELFKEFGGSTTVVTKESRRRRQGNRVVKLAPKSYAFVKVGAGNQQKAIDAFNDAEFKGEKLTVSKATVSPEELAEATADDSAEPEAKEEIAESKAEAAVKAEE